MNYWESITMRLDDRKENRTNDEIDGVTEVRFEKAGNVPDKQDNIHTRDQIVALLTSGAPPWMSDDKYPFLAGRTDLWSYKDAVLVAAKDIEEVRLGLLDRWDEERGHYCEQRVKYPGLYYSQNRFGAWDDRRDAHLVWRKEDWRIARELVAKMWNLQDEKAIHDYCDCPYFGVDDEEQWEKAAEAIEHDPDLR
jgi:hypothetical protein